MGERRSAQFLYLLCWGDCLICRQSGCTKMLNMSSSMQQLVNHVTQQALPASVSPCCSEPIEAWRRSRAAAAAGSEDSRGTNAGMGLRGQLNTQPTHSQHTDHTQPTHNQHTTNTQATHSHQQEQLGSRNRPTCPAPAEIGEGRSLKGRRHVSPQV